MNFVVSKNESETVTILDDKITNMISTSLLLAESADAELQGLIGVDPLDHSFIQAISIALLQVLYYSEALPTQHGYCVVVSR